MNYPQAPDKKIQKITNLLVRYAENKGYTFNYYDEEVYPVEAFSHFGALGLFALEAKEHYEKVYNKLYSIEELLETLNSSKSRKHPISEEDKKKDNEYLEQQSVVKKFGIELVEQEENTYFGFIVRISPDITTDFSTLSHFFIHALEEYVNEYKLKNNITVIKEPIPLDDLYNKMVMKINNDKVLLLNSETANILYANIDNSNLNKMEK